MKRLARTLVVAGAAALAWAGLNEPAAAQSTSTSISWYDLMYDFQVFLRNPHFGGGWGLWETFDRQDDAVYYAGLMASTGYDVEIKAVYAPNFPTATLYYYNPSLWLR